MQPLNPLKACATEKQKYDACFKEWYKAKFLKVSNRIAAFIKRSLSLTVVCWHRVTQTGLGLSEPKSAKFTDRLDHNEINVPRAKSRRRRSVTKSLKNCKSASIMCLTKRNLRKERRRTDSAQFSSS